MARCHCESPTPSEETKAWELEGSVWGKSFMNSTTLDRLGEVFPLRSVAEDVPKGQPPFGTLTQRGFEQLANMGFALRDSYGSKFSTPDSVRASASNYLRTQQSAQVALSAFFAPESVQTPRELEQHLCSSHKLPSLTVSVRRREECVIDAFSRYQSSMTPLLQRMSLRRMRRMRRTRRMRKTRKTRKTRKEQVDVSTRMTKYDKNNKTTRTKECHERQERQEQQGP